MAANDYRENLAWYLSYGTWQSYLADEPNNAINSTAVSSRSEADNVAWTAEMVRMDRYSRLKDR
jgi:hypothetical protein